MKNLVSLLLILSLASCNKEEFNLSLTKELSINSTFAGANFIIKIGLPENYDPGSQKYSSIYVLDGEENFDYVAEKCKQISGDLSKSNVLVISIGYGNDRSQDYTPTVTNAGGGGAESFMLFIKNELIPQIESNFAADTSRKSRVILGHSFGGLLATYAFTNYNDLFGNYILLSPSLWYDNEIMFRLEEDFRNNNKQNHQLVFMGLGQLENQGRMLVPFQAFYQRFQNHYPDIMLKQNIVSHMDHSGSKKPNIKEGLTFYFLNK